MMREYFELDTPETRAPWELAHQMIQDLGPQKGFAAMVIVAVEILGLFVKLDQLDSVNVVLEGANVSCSVTSHAWGDE